MGSKAAELTFAVAAERANPDKSGRSAALSMLLKEVQQSAQSAGWKALTFGGQQVYQVTFVLPPNIQQLTVKLGSSGQPMWELGPMNPGEGTVDCLVYNPISKAYSGVWEEDVTDAVEALAKFVVSKLG
jgi:hypothetical protein